MASSLAHLALITNRTTMLSGIPNISGLCIHCTWLAMQSTQARMKHDFKCRQAITSSCQQLTCMPPLA